MSSFFSAFDLSIYVTVNIFPEISFLFITSTATSNSAVSLKGPDYSSLIGNNSITTSSHLSDATKLPTTQVKTTASATSSTSSTSATSITTVSSSVTTKPSGPDFSSLLNATIVPSTQAITDIIGAQKMATIPTSSTTKAITLSKSTKSTPTLIPPSIPTNLVNLISNQKLSRPLSSATSSIATATNNNLNSLLGASLGSSLPGQDLSAGNYSSLLGMNAATVSNKLPVKPTPPNFPMFLPNSGIGASSIVTSPYLINTLPTTNNIPLSLLSNPGLMNVSLPTPSQQALTSAFLTNNIAAAVAGTSSSTSKTSANKLKNNSKNPQLRTTFPYY